MKCLRAYQCAVDRTWSGARWSYVAALAFLFIACAHWQSHGIEEENGSASVKLVESGPMPENCRMLGPVSATRGALQEERTVDLKLRNAAIELHGNVVRITSRTTLTAQGEVHYCSEPAPVSAPPAGMVNVAHVTPAAEGGRTLQPGRGGIEENTLDTRARELFVLGRDAYLEQRFDEALRYFNAAYELSGRYELQYNIGQSADKLHRSPEALKAFEHFLQSAPPSTLRTETEARVAALRSQ